MRDSHSDQQTPVDYSWFDLEFILYGIAGLVAISLGVRALAHWTMVEWAAGGRLLPSLALAGVSTAAVTLLIAVRSRKRWFYLGAAFTIIAVVTFLLVTAGISIPAGWLK